VLLRNPRISTNSIEVLHQRFVDLHQDSSALWDRETAEARNPLHKLRWNVYVMHGKILAQFRQPCALPSEFLLIFGQGVDALFVLIAVFDWAQLVTGLEFVQGARVVFASVRSSIVSHLFLNSLSARLDASRALGASVLLLLRLKFSPSFIQLSTQLLFHVVRASKLLLQCIDLGDQFHLGLEQCDLTARGR
jgi:hypothetical protein